MDESGFWVDVLLDLGCSRCWVCKLLNLPSGLWDEYRNLNHSYVFIQGVINTRL